MKKLSHKDFVIALGVLVAVIIIVTSVYFRQTEAEAKSMKTVPEKGIKPAAILKKVVEKFSSRTSL